jgi:F-type H+-transporting ATPase subunit b
VLGGLTLALVLGLGLHLRETRVRAQTAEASRQETAAAASAPEKQSPEKNQQEQNEDDQYLKSPSVVWLGKKLGISTDMASNLSVIGNFVLLAIGVAWLLVKLLPKTIRDRNAAIQKSLVDARTATEEARGRLSGVEERLGKLDGEIAAMRAHAEQDSSTAEQRIKATVEDEKVKILAAAEQEITAATTHAQKKLQQYAAGLAIDQAAHKLVVSAETDRLLVQGFAERLTGDDPKKGQN